MAAEAPVSAVDFNSGETASDVKTPDCIKRENVAWRAAGTIGTRSSKCMMTRWRSSPTSEAALRGDGTVSPSTSPTEAAKLVSLCAAAMESG
mmetsp:Transcript_136927/g.273125  ORF Transcript_136927/g.273125 Transcript_136927/m.273125 type:complete len:92 (-) Transcript_136927:105-380(-)